MWEISEEGLDVRSSPKKPVWEISEEGLDLKKKQVRVESSPV